MMELFKWFRNYNVIIKHQKPYIDLHLFIYNISCILNGYKTANDSQYLFIFLMKKLHTKYSRNNNFFFAKLISTEK